MGLGSKLSRRFALGALGSGPGFGAGLAFGGRLGGALRDGDLAQVHALLADEVGLVRVVVGLQLAGADFQGRAADLADQIADAIGSR